MHKHTRTRCKGANAKKIFHVHKINLSIFWAYVSNFIKIWPLVEEIFHFLWPCMILKMKTKLFFTSKIISKRKQKFLTFLDTFLDMFFPVLRKLQFLERIQVDSGNLVKKYNTIWLESPRKYIPISRISPNHVQNGGSPEIISKRDAQILLHSFSKR